MRVGRLEAAGPLEGGGGDRVGASIARAASSLLERGRRGCVRAGGGRREVPRPPVGVVVRQDLGERGCAARRSSGAASAYTAERASGWRNCTVPACSWTSPTRSASARSSTDNPARAPADSTSPVSLAAASRRPRRAAR